MPPTPIGRPVASAVFLAETSDVFEVNKSLRRTTNVPKAGPQLTKHPADQPAPSGDRAGGCSSPLLVKSESAKP
jgi:hypothetical protein